MKIRSIVLLMLCVGSLSADPEIASHGWVEEGVESVKVMAGVVSAACLYGILNDQVTARICPEYFTEGFHKEMLISWPDNSIKSAMLDPQSPTKLGLLWAVLATWREGARCAIPVVLAARAGSWPKLSVKDLARPTAISLGVLGFCAFVGGLRGYQQACKNPMILYYDGVEGMVSSPLKVFYKKKIAGDTPASAMNAYIADVYAHRMAYGSAPFVVAGLVGWMIYKRYQLQNEREVGN